MSPHFKWLASGIGLIAVAAGGLTLIMALLLGARTVFGRDHPGSNPPVLASFAAILFLALLGLLGIIGGRNLLKDPDLRNPAGPPPTPRRLVGQGIRLLIIGAIGLAWGLYTKTWLAWVLIVSGAVAVLMGVACLALSRKSIPSPPSSN